MTEWINVKDRLPSKSGTYLLYLKDQVIMTGFFSKTRAFYPDDDREYSATITYWAELPEPPKGET